MAISVSISGGNHRLSGAMPNAEAISVTECATVNDVITITSGRSLRNGNHQAQQEQQVIDAVEDVEEAFAREQAERLVPARIEMHDAGVGVHVERALGVARLQEAQHDVDLQRRGASGPGGSRSPTDPT